MLEDKAHGPKRLDAGGDRAVQTDDTSERLKLLVQVGLFAGLAPWDLLPLAEMSTTVHFEKGDVVVRQGEAGDDAYILVAGAVEVLVQSDTKDPASYTFVAHLKPGDAIGELSLIDGRPRSATCVAVRRTTCLRFGREDFVAAVHRYGAISWALLTMLAERLRNTDAQLADRASDRLTGLSSRRVVNEFFKREAARAGRSAARQAAAGGEKAGVRTPGEPLMVLVADVDGLRHINEKHGHGAGDAVLRSFAQLIASSCRATDIVARYGGDEFVAVLPEAGSAGASLVTHRVGRVLDEQPPGPVPFSVSFGSVHTDPAEPQPLDVLVSRAVAVMHAQRGTASFAG